jgi:ABC-type branched-subunit amino acid transport system substrate-binding protein
MGRQGGVMKIRLTTTATLLSLGMLAGAASAENGVTSTEITLGMCNVLTGPAAALGLGIQKGSSVYFDKINKSGGVNGRKIRVISYDDGYEPKNTVVQTRKLVQEDKVFALFGYVGTPTSTAIMPILAEAKIPFWGPFTGAEFLRNPVNKYIFNIRSSYFDEAETQVRYLTEQRGIKKIGVFLQNDAYGFAVKGGIIKALKKRNLDIVGEGSYERNTEDVSAAVAALKKASPDAVSMVGTYKAMAAFIKKAKAEGFNPVFLNVSFVGTAALLRELGAAGDGVIITQVLPSPGDTSVPIVAQYRKDMKAAGHSELDFTDLEGYVDAAIFVEVLKKAGASLTRESFLAAAESLDASVGGLAARFSPTDHQALKKTYLTTISRGQIDLVK